MPERRTYRKRKTQVVHAVQLNVDTDGFTYRKWGGTQRCAKGDWVVDNDGDVYTVNSATFARTYRHVDRGAYEKVAPVWAVAADVAGSVPTREGATDYNAGDYIVSNDEDGSDSWAVEKAKFEKMYEPIDG
jgi:hypothetical protein